MEHAKREQRVLYHSTVATVLFAVAGVALGIVSGSMSITFDGLFSFIDVAVSLLALGAARLVTRDTDRRFQYGYWHLEPMVLAFNGGMLILLSVYAAVDAVRSLLAGGQTVDTTWAIGYAAVATLLASGMYLYERNANRRLGSEFLALDSKSWLMTVVVSAAMLVAFVFAWALGATEYGSLAPYVDPAVLGLLSLILIGVPVQTVRSAISEVLRITPSELDAEVREVMDCLVEQHGFDGYTSYASKVGRGRFIEVNILLQPDRQIGTVASLDAVRTEIAEALDAHWPHTWLTVEFTADERWT